jgi:heptaprenylglyceryl phosphate synthase
VSLYGHAPEMQVSRWGLPMMTHLFLNDPADQEVKEVFNKSVPSDDIALFSGYIADYTRKMTTIYGASMRDFQVVIFPGAISGILRERPR